MILVRWNLYDLFHSACKLPSKKVPLAKLSCLRECEDTSEVNINRNMQRKAENGATLEGLLLNVQTTGSSIEPSEEFSSVHCAGSDTIPIVPD